MFFFWAPKKRSAAAQINGEQITVEPRETLLQAALRQGIEFPHHCRIGACGVCKCRLVEGQVKALTDSSYTLSDAEIADGYILACQCLPRSDVRVEVALSQQTPQKTIAGVIAEQRKVTHDITHLAVQLDTPMEYKAGQFADLGFEDLPHVCRSYSFATPPQASGKVEFFVRKAPGGVFSSLVNDQNLLGKRVTLKGPAGNFWLRPGDAPLLMAAGGSGLAPILAILQEAADLRVKRSVTLIFGARRQEDLYALEDISSIAKRWQGEFRFIPVLSEEDATGWAGKRGLVTDQIEPVLENAAKAYLCGPPAMIASASQVLLRLGVARDDIYTDAFTANHGVF